MSTEPYIAPEISEDYWEPLWPGKPITEIDDPLCRTAETWVNDKCQVYVYDYESPEGWPKMVNLSLKLNTREPWHDWRDFYRIKSELCGTSCWAIEVYPAQHALIDSANQYHMFVYEPGVEFPIQLQQPSVTDYSPEWAKAMEPGGAFEQHIGKMQLAKMSTHAKQRTWHEHHKCDDLPLIGPVWTRRGYFVNSEGKIELGDPPPVYTNDAMGILSEVMDTMANMSQAPEDETLKARNIPSKKKRTGRKNKRQNRNKRKKKSRRK
jgi:hypothetical protein